MSRTTKLLLGAVTAVPFLWMLAWFAYMAYIFTSEGAWKGFDAMFAGMAADIVLTIALSVFYARHAWRNPRLRPDERQVWAIFVVLLNAFAQPAYWYLHIWRAEGSSLPTRCQPDDAVSSCGAPTGFDSGDPRWRR
jgi:hypothetical protein